MGGMISGLLGGGNSGAQEAQMAELAKAREAVQAYRPEAMQARLNALSNMSTAYQGANNALETMYGGGGAPATGGRVDFRDSGPQKFMGHELPVASQSGGGSLPQQPTGGQPPPGGRPQIGQGNGWEDQAAMLIDPIGVFRGLF